MSTETSQARAGSDPSRARPCTRPAAGSTSAATSRSAAATWSSSPRVRHPGLRLRRGRPARARPRLPRRLPPPHRRLRGRSTRARRRRSPPPTGSSPRRASRSTSPRAASCTWRCAPASTPGAIHLHGNNKSDAELRLAVAAGVGHVDLRLASTRSTRLRRACSTGPPAGPDPGHARGSRPTPTPTSRPASSTPSSASASRTASRRARSSGCAPRATSSSSACTPTSARRSSSSSPTCGRSRRSASSPTATGAGCSTSAAGSGSPTPPRTSRPRSTPTPRSRSAGSSAVFDPVPRILVEPGRSLVGNAGVTVYRVGTVKEIPGRAHLRRRRRRHVRQPAADALRLALRGADRRPRRRRRPRRPATVAGMHCESGDILVRDAMLADARARRRPRHPGHRRLRARDGQQLQRRPAAAGDLLPRRRRPRRRPARDLRGPDPGEGPDERERGPSDRAARAGAPSAARSPSCRRARRCGRGGDRAPARDRRRPAPLARATSSEILAAQRHRRRADRRDRPGARLRPAGAARGQATSSPRTSS